MLDNAQVHIVALCNVMLGRTHQRLRLEGTEYSWEKQIFAK